MDIIKCIIQLNLIYVKGFGFLSFANNIGKNIGRNLSNRYSQKLVDSPTKATKDAVKVASKRAFPTIAKATGDLIGNKTSEKIAKASKVDPNEADNEILKERHNKLLMN